MAKRDFIFSYKVRNWPEYNRTLVRRGNLTLWIRCVLESVNHKFTMFLNDRTLKTCWLNAGRVKPNDYVVFAIGGGTVPGKVWGDNLIDNGSIVALFARIRRTQQIDLDQGLPIYECEPYVSINRGIWKPFEQPANEERGSADAALVSGVLFSHTSIESFSSHWEHKVVWINNYRATNPVDPVIFESIQRLHLREA